MTPSVGQMEQTDEQEYKDLLAKLEDKHLAETIERTPEWEVVRRAWKKIYEETQVQYNNLDHALPESKLRAMQCQVALQFYENVLESTINTYKTIGDEAYERAKEEGWLQGLMLYIKTKVS